MTASTGLVLADDLEREARPDPWIALLPSLDPTIMGWTSRDWYLAPHRARSSTGTAMPARRSGPMAASSAAGPSAPTARSSRACSRMSAPRRGGDR